MNQQVYGPNRSIVVTGASSGIGRELSLCLARHGGKLALTARRQDELEAVAEEVVRLGGRAVSLVGDVTDPESVAETHRRAVEAHGPVDVAFLNAGLGDPINLTRFSAERVKRLFEVNVFGVAHWMEALLPDMIASRRGIVAVTSSIAARVGVPSSGPYSSSKAAVSTLFEALRVEAAPFDIQLTTIEPGFVKSEMTDKNHTPMPFLMDTAPAARLICDKVAAGKAIVRFPCAHGRGHGGGAHPARAAVFAAGKADAGEVVRGGFRRRILARRVVDDIDGTVG